jgi:glycine/D-amino acid oxidase-like deaminating enzyme
MHYEMTPDGNFLIGPLPALEKVWIMGGGSGHGFKHGPSLGAYIADLIEDKQKLQPQFAIRAPTNPELSDPELSDSLRGRA